MYEASTGCLDCGVTFLSGITPNYLAIHIVTKNEPFYFQFYGITAHFKLNSEFKVPGKRGEPNLSAKNIRKLIDMDAFTNPAEAERIVALMEEEELNP